jgi:hypothetical protein
VGNAATTLTLAEQHGAAGLRDAALRFAAAHAAAVMATPGWQHLRAAQPGLIEAVMHVMATGRLPPPSPRLPLPPAEAEQGEEQASGSGGAAEGGDSGRHVRQRTR